MEKKELEALRKLQSGGIDAGELTRIHDDFRDNYRVKLSLVQHPRFPVDAGMNIISSIFTPDLMNVIRNKRCNPFIRKKCEMEFFQRYTKIPLGEKISLMKRAPVSLMEYFLNEKDSRLLKVMAENPHCTEDLIIKFVNRETDRSGIYGILIGSEWLKRRRVSFAMSHDRQLPIRLWMEIIPNLDLKRLTELADKPGLHETIKREIGRILEKKRNSDQ